MLNLINSLKEYFHRRVKKIKEYFHNDLGEAIHFGAFWFGILGTYILVVLRISKVYLWYPMWAATPFLAMLVYFLVSFILAGKVVEKEDLNLD